MINSTKNILKFFLKLYSGYYIFYGLFLLLRRLGFLYRPKQFPTIYIKEIPFYLNTKSVYKLRLIAQAFCTMGVTAAIVFVLLNNLSPLGEKVNFTMGDGKNNISDLGPKARVNVKWVDGKKIFYQLHDLVYFSTNIPFTFDSATVKVVFQNPDPDQTISVGFQDKENWHYDTQLFDVPLLDNITWNKITNKTGEVLYQRQKTFSSIDNFLINLPNNSLIGTYDYDPTIGRVRDIKLSGYKPSTTDTVIDAPLRGKHVFYVYLDHEPFTMKIYKQDLNWYEDPDVMTVKIYKNNTLVDQTIVGDDGITDGSKKVLPPQEVLIKNPQSQFPDSGIYKIVIDANSDTFVKKIETNLHKIVFQGNVFLAGNHDSYSSVVASTSATTIYTNALTLSAKTYHTSGKQTITVDDQSLPLVSLNQQQIFIPKNNFSQITIPKNDVVLSGYWGYFAFSKDQFFLPNPYRVISVQTQDDVNLVDYIFADYISPYKSGDWEVAQHTFNIRSAYIKNGKLNWVIKAPNLKDNNRQIVIKDIVVTFNKKSWF